MVPTAKLTLSFVSSSFDKKKYELGEWSISEGSTEGSGMNVRKDCCGTENGILSLIVLAGMQCGLTSHVNEIQHYGKAVYESV